jgi:hypothetical protein
MLRLTLILTFGFSLIISGFGQTSEKDSVFVKRSIGDGEYEVDTLFIEAGLSTTQVLAGTTFLPYSDKMIGLLNKGLEPISLEIIEDCNNTTHRDSFKDYPKFIAVERASDTLTIDVQVIANCCHNFLGEAEVVGNDTLNLVYTSYGGFCACYCRFTLRYKFDVTFEADYHLLNHVTINGSKITGVIPKKD